MKQLVCEMCGSTELMKQDGAFVCQICGCKYSVEEAKKMMIEGTVDVSGSTVKVDNTGMIDNYLNLAMSAIDSSNNQEAEAYANKIIELDPQNAMAWTVKGAAAGWQHTGANNRFKEATDCWINAINYVNGDEAVTVLEYISSTGKSIADAIVTMHCNNFISYRDPDNAKEIMDNAHYIINNVSNLMSSVKSCDYSSNLSFDETQISDEEIMKHLAEQLSETNKALQKFVDWYDEILESFAQKFHNAAVSGCNAAIDDFGPDKSDMSDYAYSKWLGEMTCCIGLEKSALSYAEKVSTLEIIFKNLKDMHELMISSCSYEYQVYGSVSGYFESKSLTDSAKAKHRSDINEARLEKDKRIAEIKKRAEDEKKKRIDKYWEEHADEKLALEQEKKELLDEIESIKTQRQKAVSIIKDEIEPIKVTCNAEVCEFSKLIDDLTSEKNSLGIFKGKEKKAIQERIADAENKKKAIQSKCNAQIAEVNNRVEIEAKPYDDKIANLNKRVKEIETELTKER